MSTDLTSICSVFTFVLTDGGTGCLFWGFIAVTCGMLLVCDVRLGESHLL